MAGDWIKFECSLPEKAETLAITAAMGWDDPDLTVGKLMRLFRWFDQQTTDGNANNVTAALLDRVVGVTGFIIAVANTGWVVISDSGVSLHNFEKHNGATAKSRLLTAKRVANYKSNAKGNADTVTKALPREEKRREEIDKSNTDRTTARGSRLPKDFEPDFQFAVDSGIQNTLEEESKFRDYWNAQPGQKGVKMDWPATWRNWCRNAKPTRSSNPNKQEALESRNRAVGERWAAGGILPRAI